MKRFFILLSFLFVLLKQINAQDSLSRVNETWNTVKTHLEEKTGTALNIITLSRDSKLVNKALFTKTKTLVLVLKKSLAVTDNTDSLSASVINNRNDSLTFYINKLLAQLKKDKKFNHSGALHEYETRLEGYENRIIVSVYEYNKACREDGKPELIFKEKDRLTNTRIEF